MTPPGIPKNEAERIQVLHDLLILDTDPEGRFDIITAYCQSGVWGAVERKKQLGFCH